MKKEPILIQNTVKVALMLLGLLGVKSFSDGDIEVLIAQVGAIWGALEIAFTVWNRSSVISPDTATRVIDALNPPERSRSATSPLGAKLQAKIERLTNRRL